MQTLGIDDRRFGSALLVFGLVGVLVAGIVAIALLLGGVQVRSMADELEADRLALVDSLKDASVAVGGASLAAANARATLGSTEAAIRNANETLLSLAESVDSLADALHFQVLGQQPLAGAADSFAALADQVRGFSDDLDAIAVDLVSNQKDLDDMSEGLRDLQRRLDALTTRIEEFDRVDELVSMASWGIVLLGAVVAWVAAAGGIVAWLGWRLRRGVPAPIPPTT